MRRLERAWHWVIEAIAWGSRLAIGIMMALITVEVVGRKLFALPIRGTVEIVAALMVVIVFLAWSYTQSHDGHVRVEFLVQRLGHKTRSMLEAIIILVMLGIFSIMIWQTLVYALDAQSVGLRYDTARIAIFPFRLVVSIGIFFLWLQLLIRLVSSIAGLLPARTQLSEK